LATDHPLEWNRFQVANCYMGRVGLINSGGEAGKSDLHDAVSAAVINKRSGGMGLILGRKAFKKPKPEGIKILNAVQDVYLCKDITIA
jgi:class I fructose-bisphosphate aldolase